MRIGDARSLARQQSAKATVLVVEDNVDLNQFIVQSLADDYLVFSALDGQQGLEIALTCDPALILADIMMPQMSGAEMIAAMRAHAELSEIPILLLSEAADEALKKKLLEDGAHDFIAKPFSKADLRARVKNLLRLRTSQDRYETLFQSMDQGFCTVEVIFDANQKPIDYRFLEINGAFEKQTGLINAQGKRMRELAPMHEQHGFEIYGNIALTGKPARFENRASALGRWYDVYAFRVGLPNHRRVAIFFNGLRCRIPHSSAHWLGLGRGAGAGHIRGRDPGRHVRRCTGHYCAARNRRSPTPK